MTSPPIEPVPGTEDPFFAATEAGPVEAGQPPVHHNASGRSFVRNVVFSYAATFASLLAGAVVTPILFRSLHAEGFGVFALLTSIAGFALLADLGVGTSTVRRVAAAVAVGDDRALATAVASSRTLVRASAGLSFAVLAVIAWRLPSLFDLPPELAMQARWSLLVLAAGQSLLVAFSTPTSVLVGYGRADLYAKRSLVLGLATAAAQCLLAVSGAGVVGVSAAVATSCVVSAVIGVRLQRHVLGDRLPVVAPSGGEVRDVIREGAANFVISVAGAVAFTSDAIVLGAVAPFAAVAAYAVAARIPTLVRTLSSKAIDLLAPTYSHLDAADDDDAVLRVLARTTKFSMALAMTTGLITSTCTRLLLRAWLGEVPEHAQAVVWLLTAATVLQMSGHAVFVLLTGLRRLRWLLVFSVGSATANIVLSVLFTVHLGAPGPALASLVCVGVGDLVVLPALAARTLGVAPTRIVTDLTLVPVLPAVPAVALAVALGVPSSSGASLGVAAAVAGVYLAGFWLLLGPAERRWFAGSVRRLRQRRDSAVA